MKPKPFRMLAAIPLLIGALTAIPSCQPAGGDRAGGPTAKAAVQKLLAGHQGKVLLLLLGREDCPGTAKATAVLDAYVPRKPADVDVVRLDVPLPGETLKVGGWTHPFPRELDADRAVADGLEFFYYPTVYVFDRGGELRFAGGYDAERLETMAKEIGAEQPGQPKKSYTLPLPPIGSPAPPLAARTLTGQDATLATLRGGRATMLVFSRTSCPFSMQALPAVKSMADTHRSKGIAVVLINQGEDQGQIRPVYEKQAPGVPVVWDATGEICKAYGVDTVPFFFLLNKDGAIAQRRSFTPPAATGALNALLGIAAEAPRYKTSKAG